MRLIRPIVPVVLGMLIATLPAFAAKASLLVGAWTIDLSKLTMPDPPRDVTIVFANVGGGQYRMTVDIVDHDGAKRHQDGAFKPDGAPYPTVGNADYDLVSMTMPSRRILVMGGGFRRHPANTRVFSLSDDGMHMIETVISHDPDGTPHTRVDVWNRLK